MTKTKTIEFGKIAYSNKNRKANMVDVEIRLSTEHGRKTFSVVGNIWNTSHTDIVAGGQILDTMAKYIKMNPVFREVHDLWKKYHLNDMHVGTRKQEEFVKKHFEKVGRPYDYTEAVSYLVHQPFFVDALDEDEDVKGRDRNAYEYGTGWIYRAIPKDDLKRIEKLFKQS